MSYSAAQTSPIEGFTPNHICQVDIYYYPNCVIGYRNFHARKLAVEKRFNYDSLSNIGALDYTVWDKYHINCMCPYGCGGRATNQKMRKCMDKFKPEPHNGQKLVSGDPSYQHKCQNPDYVSKESKKVLENVPRMAFRCPKKFFDNGQIQYLLQRLQSLDTQKPMRLIVEGQVNEELNYDPVSQDRVPAMQHDQKSEQIGTRRLDRRNSKVVYSDAPEQFEGRKFQFEPKTHQSNPDPEEMRGDLLFEHDATAKLQRQT